MSKGFGYRYDNGKVNLSFKYGPIIAGVVVNNEWRRIGFSSIDRATAAIKSLEKANMYEQYMGYRNKLEEVPDTYFVSFYDVHLGPWLKDYIPSDRKLYDVDGNPIRAKSKTKSIPDRNVNPSPGWLEWVPRLMSTGRSTYSIDWGTDTPQTQVHDSYAYPAPIPTNPGHVDYPIDRAIDNMRGTQQERDRANRQREMRNALDRLAGIAPRRTRT